MEKPLTVKPVERRGRPRNAEPGSAVMTWLPAREHDRLIRLAERRGESVSSTVRLLLQTQWKRAEVKPEK